jgi:pyridoxamine 5'-phosphate oxidase family protein
MSVFTEKEIEYLGTQRLGRLATIDSAGNPHVVPVGFRYNPETDTIDIGGHQITRSRKWAHAAAHPRVAFVVDDVLPPWRPRLVEIKADVELLQSGGQSIVAGFDPELMRLRPVRIVTFGLESGDLEQGDRTLASRKVGG